MSQEKTIFKKIIDGEIPADIVYQDERCLAFRDIEPQAPVHLLLIPKQEIVNLSDLSDQALAGHLMLAIGKIAQEQGFAETGYRVVVNCGRDGGQAVDHLHFHILAGRSLSWPPG